MTTKQIGPPSSLVCELLIFAFPWHDPLHVPTANQVRLAGHRQGLTLAENGPCSWWEPLGRVGQAKRRSQPPAEGRWRIGWPADVSGARPCQDCIRPRA